ncbi:MAG: phage tail tape measure protein [Candidatus Ornithomonoglobus sp.]
MAGAIKGITIEFDGNTTKLSKAIGDVNKESKTLQQELRGINTLLKMDPSSTELLSQKQKVLAESISTTKEKLETLKSVQEQVNEQFEKGEIGEKEYRDFQREIEATEQKLKSLTSEMKEFGSVSAQQIAAAGEKVKDVGGKIESAGKAMMPVSAALAGVGTAAVKVTADFDSAMSQVKALSGATGDDFDKLREKAQEMGAKTAFSATEAAEGLQYMALAGWNTSQMLNGIEGILNLAAAAQMDLGEASDIVTDALTAFGLSAEDSAHFADILAQTSSKANTDVKGLGEAFKYCAPVAGALGFTAEDTSLAIGLMANAGIKASQAGTSLRSIFSALTSTIALSTDEGECFIVTTTNQDGSMRSLRDILIDTREAFSHLSEAEQARNAKIAFGKQAMSGMLAIVNASDESFNALANSIDNCGGAAQTMADIQLDNLSGQMTLLKSALEGAMISIGDVITPAISKAVEVIQSLVDKFNELPTSAKEVIVAIGAIVAAIGPCLIIVGKLMESVGTIMTVAPQIVKVISGIPNVISTIGSVLSAIPTVLSTIGTALSGLWALMLANPITLIIAAVAALVAAFVILWNKCDAFREFWINLWDNISSFFSDIWNTISETAQKAWESIVSFFTEGIPNFFAKVKEWFEQLPYNIGYALGLAIGKVAQWVIDMVDKAHEMGSDFIAKVIEFFTQLPTKIAEFTKSALNNIITFAKEAPGKAKEMAANFLKNVTETLKTLPDKIGGFLKEAVSKAASWVKDMGSKGKEAITHMLSNIVDAAKSIPSKMMEIGKNIVQGVWNGIVSAKNWFVNKVKDFFSGIVDGVKDALGIHSPSKVFADEIGKQIPAGIGQGIESNISAAIRPLNSMTNKMVDTTKRSITAIGDNIKHLTTVISGEGSAIINNAKRLTTVISGEGSAIINNVRNNTKEASYIISDGVSKLGTVITGEGTVIVSKLNGTISSFADKTISKIKRLTTSIKQELSFSSLGTLAQTDETAMNVLRKVVSLCDDVNTAVANGSLAETISEITNEIQKEVKNSSLGTLATTNKSAAAILKKITSFCMEISETVSGMSTEVKESVSEITDPLKSESEDTTDNILSTIITWADDTTNKAKETAEIFVKSIEDKIAELPKIFTTILNDVSTQIDKWTVEIQTKGKKAIEGLKESIILAAVGFPKIMNNIGKNIVSGIWNGIQSMENSFRKNIERFFENIVDSVKDALGIHSPSKVFANEVGKWIPAGVGEGITDNAQSALTPLKKLFDDIIASAPEVAVTAAAAGGTSAPAENYLEMLNKILDKLNDLGDIRMYLDGKKLVGSIIKYIDSELSNISRQKARGM